MCNRAPPALHDACRLDRGGVVWVTVDLPPGSYATVCVIHEPASGPRQVELGMIKEFTVS